NPLLGTTTSLQEQVSNFVINGDDDYTDELASLDQIEADLADVEVALEEFAAIDSTVLISPFKSNVLQLSEVPISDIDFFVPAALALLIQHIAVSFAALSIIRERRLGTLDLLRIAPSSALELLLGKTIGYLVVIIFIAAILTALITLLMGVPMAGSWLIYAGILLAVTFLSLGMGFVISTISQTETQAVQLAMLLLLASVFFSGLFLAIERIWLPVRTVSWLLPATYGTALLQDVMLRGQEPNALVFGGLLGLGVLFFLLSWRALSRYLRRE
ncbi:MAG: ABC transporter permease, partial [Anaerolineales bacterium]|nr:ABC transporter permease [Anaerolineales bacterium]